MGAAEDERGQVSGGSFRYCGSQKDDAEHGHVPGFPSWSSTALSRLGEAAGREARDRKSSHKSAASLDAVLSYAKDSDAWLSDLLVAWKKVTENGMSDLCQAPPAPPTPAPTSAPTPAPTLAPAPAPALLHPAELLTCHAGQAAEETTGKSGDEMKKLSRQICDAVILHQGCLGNQCNDKGCPKGGFVGCLVRLVGHDFMDFKPSSGSCGADGCIDFADPDNLGLQGCLLDAVQEADSVNVTLESMWQEWCTEVSVADFFVIAAEALMRPRFRKHSAPLSGVHLRTSAGFVVRPSRVARWAPCQSQSRPAMQSRRTSSQTLGSTGPRRLP